LAIADEAVLLAHGSVAWSGPADQASVAMEALLSSRPVLTDDENVAGGGAGPPSDNGGAGPDAVVTA
jgi:hypothetical protein